MTISAAATTFVPTATTGTISGPHGRSTFTRIVSGSGDQRSVDITHTTASGRVIEDQVSITRNADGSTTREATRAGPKGQTASDSLIYSAPQNGVRTISGTVTNEAGQTGAVTGSTAKTAAGRSQSLSYTNEAGETATHATETTRSGRTGTIGVANTGFSGTTHGHRKTVTVTIT